LPGKVAWGRPVRTFQDLRAIIMTKKQENTGGNPHSGPEKPELQCLLLITPRKIKYFQKNRRDKTRIRRISHGIARAFEGLRGVRLSLVPLPKSRKRVLQGV
jgi:hypothetical protein